MDCVDRLLVLALYDHSYLANAPDVVGISHVDVVANFDFIQFFLQLPVDMLKLLFFPFCFEEGVVLEVDCLLDDVVNHIARQQVSSLGCPNSLVTNEAMLLDD